MTYPEPERLAIQLRELIERRAALRSILRAAIVGALSDEERADLLRMVDTVDTEMAGLEKRLESLLNAGPKGDGTSN